MKSSIGRTPRVLGGVCLIGAAAFAATASSAAGAPGAMRVVEGRFPVYAFAPPTDLARPVTLYLHGMCGDPSNGCGALREGVVDRSWLLCPSAPASCPGGGAIWSVPFESKTRTIAEAEQQLLAQHPAEVDLSTERVIIGFSQGAYLAQDLVRSRSGRYRGVLFLGASIDVSASELRAAGVRRVAFGAGRLDMTFARMRAQAEAVKRAGLPARFVDLGNVGHTYVPQKDSLALRETLAWLEDPY